VNQKYSWNKGFWLLFSIVASMRDTPGFVIASIGGVKNYHNKNTDIV